MAFSINSLLQKNTASEDYKRGYDDCEKKYKALQQQYETALRQIKKLGYEIGEEPNMLNNASVLAKHCKSNISCDGCEFHLKKEDRCFLAGENPAEWKIM